MSQSTRHLAVGATLEQAAQAFGGLVDDVELTTYAEVGGHVDLELLGSLSLVSGASSDALLSGIVAQHQALGPAAPPVFVGHEGEVVQVLPGASPHLLLNTAPGPGTPVSSTRSPSQARRWPTLGQLIIGAVALGVLAVLLVVFAAVLGGTSWALLVLGLEVSGAQAILVAVVGYAVLLLRRHVAGDEENQIARAKLSHQSDQLLEHARENAARQRSRFDSVDGAVADLRGTRDRVDALSRLVSRDRAAERDTL